MMRTREGVSRGGIGGLLRELPTQLEGMNMSLFPTKSERQLLVRQRIVQWDEWLHFFRRRSGGTSTGWG